MWRCVSAASCHSAFMHPPSKKHKASWWMAAMESFWMEFPYFIDEKTEHRNVKGFEGLLEEKVVIIMTEPVLKYIMPCVPFLTAHPVDPTRYQSFLDMWRMQKAEAERQCYKIQGFPLYTNNRPCTLEKCSLLAQLFTSFLLQIESLPVAAEHHIWKRQEFFH